MKSFQSKSFSLSMLSLVIIAGSCTSSYAAIGDWFTGKRLASLAVIAAVGRLVTKDVNKTDSNFYSEMNKLRNKPLTKAWLTQVLSVVDDYVIGYPGRGRGVKVVGSSISIEGEKEALGSYLDADNLQISLYGYNRIDASGVLGITWAYLKEIVGGLKFVKEVDEMGTSFGMIETSFFAGETKKS